MSTDLYRESLGRFQPSVAEMIGCATRDWASNDLVIVERPADSPEKYVSLLVTFGTGTAWSVEPEYLELARAQEFRKHFLAFGPQAASTAIVTAAEARGENVHARSPNLGFLLGEVPAAPTIPAGLSLQHVDLDLRAKWEPGGRFENALGDEHGAPYFRFGLALVTPAGEPAAVTGAYEDRGDHLEIGVDVAKEYRGGGLARVIVSLMARHIVESGQYPTYYCAATNVRSHRTALACGFVPTLSSSVVRRATPPAETE